MQTTNSSCSNKPSLAMYKNMCALLTLFSVFTLSPVSTSFAAAFDGKLKSVTITDSAAANAPPTAVINFSKDGDVINFDASGSSDSDGRVVSYMWDFGDGTTGTGAMVSHQSVPENTPITLTVADDKGGVALTQVTIETNLSDAFSDDFSIDTTKDFTISRHWGSTGKFLYDAQGQRVRVLTGDNTNLTFSRSIPSSHTGIFSIDFLPTVFYPYGGKIDILLMQDLNNYYRIYNTDGYGPGKITKFVNGVQTDSAQFLSEYSQNQSYNIVINFSPDQTIVEAFGERIVMNANKSPISISSFEITTEQQDANYDNMSYSNIR